MIGKLVSVNTRTVYDKKVVRLTVDIPYAELKNKTLKGRSAIEYLHNRVDRQLALMIRSLEDEGQAEIDSDYGDYTEEDAKNWVKRLEDN